ncbi:hypothetical protein D3C71_1576840 [compost metagenome]
MAAEVHDHGRILLALDRDLAGAQRLHGHDFLTAGEHLELILQIGGKQCLQALRRRQFATDALTDGALERARTVEDAFVLDVGGLEGLGDEALRLHDLAGHDGRDERRQAAAAVLDIEVDFLARLGLHGREERIEDERRGGRKLGDHTREDAGGKNVHENCS